MITIKKEGILLMKTALSFEDEGVLNPAVIKEGNTVHLLYRAVRKGNHSTITIEGYVYSACAALMDLENPHIELARLPYALFTPEHEWELKGEVNNVVFPTGTALFDDTLYIYYGAADQRIACASVSLKELVNELVSNIEKK